MDNEFQRQLWKFHCDSETLCELAPARVLTQGQYSGPQAGGGSSQAEELATAQTGEKANTRSELQSCCKKS